MTNEEWEEMVRGLEIEVARLRRWKLWCEEAKEDIGSILQERARLRASEARLKAQLRTRRDEALEEAAVLVDDRTKEANFPCWLLAEKIRERKAVR